MTSRIAYSILQRDLPGRPAAARCAGGAGIHCGRLYACAATHCGDVVDTLHARAGLTLGHGIRQGLRNTQSSLLNGVLGIRLRGCDIRYMPRWRHLPLRLTAHTRHHAHRTATRRTATFLTRHRHTAPFVACYCQVAERSTHYAQRDHAAPLYTVYAFYRCLRRITHTCRYAATPALCCCLPAGGGSA